MQSNQVCTPARWGRPHPAGRCPAGPSSWRLWGRLQRQQGQAPPACCTRLASSSLPMGGQATPAVRSHSLSSNAAQHQPWARHVMRLHVAPRSQPCQTCHAIAEVQCSHAAAPTLKTCSLCSKAATRWASSRRGHALHTSAWPWAAHPLHKGCRWALHVYPPHRSACCGRR